jgi:ABC-type multidrug transport system, ATPase component
MKQKLGLACALLGTPELLLLDEPGVGVDPISRRELWKMVHELAGQGIAVVWSTSTSMKRRRATRSFCSARGSCFSQASRAI